jgi:UDP-N-acetylglucosamine 4,6-dehydratase/5-epimerase
MYRRLDDPRLRMFRGDVRDEDRLKYAMTNVQLVIHAAALKVVPSIEYNPLEAIKTNINGAQNVINSAIANTHAGVWPKVMAISTDKAVQPINLYGATKLCAEKLLLDANNMQGDSGPRFSICRYGNVSGSNGSVIPLFKKQIEAKENLTITHDQMTRFWITLDEACTLVFNGLDAMHGGEIFIPKMRAYNIKQLAMLMMKQAGYPSENQWCKVIGIRPGEKLHEIIMTREELQKSAYIQERQMFVYTNQGVYDPDMGLTEDITSNLPPLLMSDEELSLKLEQM